MPPKLCLIMVDSLRTDMLRVAIEERRAPHFEALLERGTLIDGCVSSFPSVTPVASAEIATGATPDRHGIAGMNWFHRTERRYVEYGTSFEATRAFGLFRALYDVVYNMNMAHLSPEVETVFERLADAGLRSACTPFLIYRGRTRHEVGLEGLLRRAAVAAKFHHATWGPDELFWGELYASRRVPCKPTLARPGTRDEYSACVGRELVREDLYDFLLFSLPDNDHHTHTYGVSAMSDSIALADDAFGAIVAEAGGMDAFCEQNAVILMADHGQTDVDHAVPIAAALGAEWRVLSARDRSPEHAELAVSPTSRAAHVYSLERRTGRRRRMLLNARRRLQELDGVDLVAWLQGTGTEREAVVVGTQRGRRRQLRFAPGSQELDRRGRGWDLEGNRRVLELGERDGRLDSDAYPDALGRLWGALASPHGGDLVVSLAEGYECVDWGGATHLGGASHGSLLAGDSNVPLVLVGMEPGVEQRHDQWRLTDVGELVLEHFGAAA